MASFCARTSSWCLKLSSSLVESIRDTNKFNVRSASPLLNYGTHIQKLQLHCVNSIRLGKRKALHQGLEQAAQGEPAMEHLYALDFDGVLCDSCGESSFSAYKAATLRWPKLFTGVTEETQRRILDSMKLVRPVVETGYENLLLVRLLLELEHPSETFPSALKDLSVNDILESWETLKPSLMEAWGEHSKEELVEAFGQVRDHWIEEDPLGWVAANRFYAGIADLLKSSPSLIYIVTTKQARFASLLLKEIARVEFPPEQIYGLGSGPKVEVLKKLQELPGHEGYTLHFVEDRLATLKNVMKDPELQKWNLYLVTWGYNTATERANANAMERIHVMDLPDFCTRLLKN